MHTEIYWSHQEGGGLVGVAFETLVSETGVNLTHTGNTMGTVNRSHFPCSALLSGLWFQMHQAIVVRAV